MNINTREIQTNMKINTREIQTNMKINTREIQAIMEKVQQQVQEKTGLPWEIQEVDFRTTFEAHLGCITWKYELEIGLDDGPTTKCVVKAQSSISNPTHLYGISLDAGGMEFLSIVYNFFA